MKTFGLVNRVGNRTRTFQISVASVRKNVHMIKSVFEDGYSWVVIDDAAWRNAIFNRYFDGCLLRTK